MNSIFFEIAIQQIEFFVLASNSEINPDSAVRQLEFIATGMKRLSKDDQENFSMLVDHRIKQLRGQNASNQQIDVLLNLREHLGV